MKNRFTAHVLRSWLPIAFVASVGFFGTYAAVQQVYRQNANDPQIEIARNLTSVLSLGKSYRDLETSLSIDASQSISVFVNIYDAKGAPLVGTGKLHDTLIAPPAGVFQVATKANENRVTLQPERGVRIAAIIRPYQNPKESGYVLVGRSLSESERRTGDIGKLLLCLWIFGLVGSLAIRVLTVRPTAS